MKQKITLSIASLLCSYLLFTFLQTPQESPTYEALLNTYKQAPALWPKPFIDSTVNWTELGMLPKAIFRNNSLRNEEEIALGHQLFFDPRLSRSKQIACASCHHPDQNWTDNRRVSLGHNLQQGKRNAPTILNLSQTKLLFWDGRATSIEDQVHFPMNDGVEMNAPNKLVENRVAAIEGYRNSFKKIYHIDRITITAISNAIGAFERSIISRKSKFDRFLEGKKELSFSELRGLHLFRTKARCMNCHNGPLFTDDSFHNIGLTYYKRKYEDLGRYNQTHKKEDVGKFRTPILRDVMFTGPWMHNGIFNSMPGILNMYSAGMPRPKPREGQENDSLFPVTSPLLKNLDLTKQDKEDIIAFLQAISSKSLKIPFPDLPK